jgi:D-xylose transport system substrate-binding protein
MLSSRKAPTFLSIAAMVAIVVSGCSTATSTPGGGAPAGKSPVAATGCKVGVSWNNYQEERWAKWDEPAIKKALDASGAIYLSNDAKSSSDTQASNVDALINQGAKVVIILAQDGVAIKASVTKALAAGVAVIAYDRLIEDSGAFYITFDNVLVGHMQAAAIFAVKPTGNYVIIKGNKADANADFLRKGISEVLDAPVASGAIKIVGEQYTDNWDPTNAQNEMAAILLAQNNKVDAVVSENDGMAGGVVAALQSQGMAGTVPVSGQDGDAAALNRIALGTQTVDVWKDARLLGQSAGEAAAMLCNGSKLDTITTSNGNALKFTSPGGNNLDSILLKPQAITKSNLSVVLDAAWITKDKLCQGVTAGAVQGC